MNEKERFSMFLMTTYVNSKLGKMINRPSPVIPKENRRYSLDGQEMIYVLWMYDMEQPADGWRCIASDYNVKQIESIREYIEHISRDMEIERYKYKTECIYATCLTELRTNN